MVETDGNAHFGAGRLFLADSRLALGLLNQSRYWVLARVFGASREDANLLTFVLGLTAIASVQETARRVVSAPLRLSGADAAVGGLLVREAAMGVVGPKNREVPMFGALVATAVVGSLALPGLRRAARGLRAAEHRVRERRIGRYVAAGRHGAA